MTKIRPLYESGAASSPPLQLSIDPHIYTVPENKSTPMKRFQFSALSCLALVATTASANADIIISEIVDGPLSGGTPKWVELTNTGSSDVDLAGYSLGNMNNGGTTLGGSAASILSGILSPGASYVINFDNDNDPFNSVYGFDADHLMGGGYINGDDTVLLYLGAATGDGSDATLIDIYGVKGVDGSGEDWEYADGYSYRIGTSGNNGFWDANDWFIGGLNSLEAGCGGDDACEEVNLQTLTTPGTHGAPSAGPDDCSGATAIAGDGVYPFDATGATTGVEGQNEALCASASFGFPAIDNDVWFEWTAGSDGTVVVSTCNDATADTKIAAYPGGGCPADGSAIVCNDDASGCTGWTSSLGFSCVAGTSYLIQVGHFPGTPGGTGNVTITTTAPPTGPNPDNCDEATAIAGDGVYPFDATTATTGAEGQNEAICMSYGSTAIDNDVWFEWTADTDGTVNVSTCNDANDDTKIAAYPGGSCPTDGSSLACNDDGVGCAGFTSSMDFACVAGTSYLIQVGHFPNTAGTTGNVTITQTVPCPADTYCYGDGSGTACPCGNSGGACAGCANSGGTGATLSVAGTPSLSADSIVLTADGLISNLPCLFFSGTNQVNTGNGIAFGDGLRCAGNAAVRIEVSAADVNGSCSSSVEVSTHGQAYGNTLSAGEVVNYQCWYRDNTGVCGNSHNLTNGLTLTWDA
jgi:hypothetical protein